VAVAAAHDDIPTEVVPATPSDDRAADHGHDDDDHWKDRDQPGGRHVPLSPGEPRRRHNCHSVPPGRFDDTRIAHEKALPFSLVRVAEARLVGCGLRRRATVCDGTQNPVRRGWACSSSSATCDKEATSISGTRPLSLVDSSLRFTHTARKGKDRPVLVIGQLGDSLAVLPLTSRDKTGYADCIELGSGAWDKGRPVSFVRLDRVLRVGAGEGTLRGRHPRTSPLRPRRRQAPIAAPHELTRFEPPRKRLQPRQIERGP
jgi:hypothetical protein